jgi:hypothetical protein
LKCAAGARSHGKSAGEPLSKVLKACVRTIDRIRQKSIEGGLEKALERSASGRVYEKKTDGDLDASIVQSRCGEPPRGFSKRSLRMPAEKVVERGYVTDLSHASVHATLKKTNLNLGKPKDGQRRLNGTRNT